MSYKITNKELHLKEPKQVFFPEQLGICKITRNQRYGITKGIDGIKGLAPGDIPSNQIEPLAEAYYEKVNAETRVLKLTPEGQKGFISITIVTLLGTALLSFIIFNIVSKLFIQ